MISKNRAADLICIVWKARSVRVRCAFTVASIDFLCGLAQSGYLLRDGRSSKQGSGRGTAYLVKLISHFSRLAQVLALSRVASLYGPGRSFVKPSTHIDQGPSTGRRLADTSKLPDTGMQKPATQWQLVSWIVTEIPSTCLSACL